MNNQRKVSPRLIKAAAAMKKAALAAHEASQDLSVEPIPGLYKSAARSLEKSLRQVTMNAAGFSTSIEYLCKMEKENAIRRRGRAFIHAVNEGLAKRGHREGALFQPLNRSKKGSVAA